MFFPRPAKHGIPQRDFLACHFRVGLKRCNFFAVIAVTTCDALSQVSYARPSSEQIKGANLYVSGLPKSWTVAELENLFAPYGAIITSRILCDNITGKLLIEGVKYNN